MGVEDLSKCLRKHNACPNNLAELRGTTCGEDLSVILHQLKNRQYYCWDFHAHPPVDMSKHVNSILDTVKALYNKAGVQLVLYADGCPHPGKAAEDASRAEKREKARKAFRFGSYYD